MFLGIVFDPKYTMTLPPTILHTKAYDNKISISNFNPRYKILSSYIPGGSQDH